MPLSETQRDALFEGLISRGWQLRGESIFAPHGTMWLNRVQPWSGDLTDFQERMIARLRRNESAKWMYEHKAKHCELVSDTRSLVDTLTKLVSSPDSPPEMTHDADMGDLG